MLIYHLMGFLDRLSKSIERSNSLLCIGLDIDKDKMPKFLFQTSDNPYLEFNKNIIDMTKDIVCAYKLNLAFYEALGENGFSILKKTVEYIPKDIIVILDGKRNDIGNTARKYAEALFDYIGGDAVTLNPYLGIDGVKPFLTYPNKGCFILCKTSNPSSKEIQDLNIDGKPLYYHIARKILEWDKISENGTATGAVVGATYPDELKEIRELLGEKIPILIPGIGKQGGDIGKTVRFGTNSDGGMAIINSSRSIIYAGSDENFAEASRSKAEKLRDTINFYRRK